MFIKTKQHKKKRDALRAQVRWCTEMALEAYLKNDADACRRWEIAAAETQDKILRLYPRFQKPIKTRRIVYVPVTVPTRKAIEVAE